MKFKFKRKKQTKEKKLIYAIIGVGRFGGALAKELYAKGCDILIVDRNPDQIRYYRNLTDNAFVVDDLGRDTLRRIGVHNCDVAVVCVGSRIDDSIMITLDLVSLGIPHVIAKALNEKHGFILEKIGAEVVYPERDMALRLASRLDNSKTLDYIRVSEKVNITKVKITEKGANKTILNLKIRKKYECNIVAVERGTEVNDNVRPDTVLYKNDVIYVTGTPEHLAKLIKHV